MDQETACCNYRAMCHPGSGDCMLCVTLDQKTACYVSPWIKRLHAMCHHGSGDCMLCVTMDQETIMVCGISLCCNGSAVSHRHDGEHDLADVEGVTPVVVGHVPVITPYRQQPPAQRLKHVTCHVIRVDTYFPCPSLS